MPNAFTPKKSSYVLSRIKPTKVVTKEELAPKTGPQSIVIWPREEWKAFIDQQRIREKVKI